MRLLAASVLATAVAASAQPYRCDWAVNGIGGGEMGSTAYRCGATAGQTAAGLTGGARFRAFIGFWQAEYQVGIQEQTPMPGVLRPVLTAAPNPFGSRVNIRYALGGPGPASLQVFDRVGRLVRSWTFDRTPSLSGLVHWDGTDGRGRMLAGGVYFCRLAAGDCRLTEKLVLQR